MQNIALDTYRAMLRGALSVNGRSIEAQAFRKVVNAIEIAGVVTGGWRPFREVSAIDWAEALEEGRHEATCPTQEEWEAATLEVSAVDDSMFRIVVGDRVWIVERSVEGGYGDDGLGVRDSFDLVVEGSKKR